MAEIFEVDGRRAAVHPGHRPDAPLILLQSYGREPSGVLKRLRGAGAPDFSLVEVFCLSWTQDMSPWTVPALAAGGEPEEGHADAWLARLLCEVLPEAERRLDAAFGEPAAPVWRGIAGYSLAGLFALYALYRTDAFCCAACASPSLWVPGMMELVRGGAPKRPPRAVYFSIGRKESKTRQPLMQTAEAAVREAAARFEAEGVPCAFELNPGGHFSDPDGRMAAGILWLLRRQQASARSRFGACAASRMEKGGTACRPAFRIHPRYDSAKAEGYFAASFFAHGSNFGVSGPFGGRTGYSILGCSPVSVFRNATI